MNEGKSLEEKMAEWKNPTGGKWFHAGEFYLGGDILVKVKSNIEVHIWKEQVAKDKVATGYAEMVRLANYVKSMLQQTGKQVKDLKNSNLRSLLLPIKNKDKMPILKQKMIKYYELWKYRAYLQTTVITDEAPAVVEEEEGEGVDGSDEGDEF